MEKPKVRLDVVKEAFVPVFVDHAFFQVHEVGDAGPSGIRYHDIEASEFGESFLYQSLNG